MAPEVDVRFAPEAPQYVIIGILGAFIGSWLLRQLAINLGTGLISAIVNATIGAVLLLLILRDAPQRNDAMCQTRKCYLGQTARSPNEYVERKPVGHMFVGLVAGWLADQIVQGAGSDSSANASFEAADGVASWFSKNGPSVGTLRPSMQDALGRKAIHPALRPLTNTCSDY